MIDLAMDERKIRLSRYNRGMAPVNKLSGPSYVIKIPMSQ